MKVTYIDHMGTDLSIVNAARVSFGKKSEWEGGSHPDFDPQKRLSDRDTKLIQFLARGCTTGDWYDLVASGIIDTKREDIESLLRHVKNMPTHWTPFGHTAITLHIKAPIFVARQLGKHQVGMVWNEVSRRYVTDEPEFYEPKVWRNAADNVKQGSSDEAVDSRSVYSSYADLEIDPDDINQASLGMYKRMLEIGVCPEQARMVLPQSMYTEWYWTGNLYSLANMFIQRTDSHAQKEVQEVAHQIGDIIRPLFPVSWEALTNG